MMPKTDDTTMVSTTRSAVRHATESAAHASNLVSTVMHRLGSAPLLIGIARKGDLSKAAQQSELWWNDAAVEGAIPDGRFKADMEATKVTAGQ